MLAAELAVAAEPVEEEARAGGDDLRWLEGDLFVALGGVVGVEGLEGGVERGRKDVERCGQGVELDEPTVATLGAVGEEVKRRGGVGADGGGGDLRGLTDGAFGVIDHELFAECVDEMLRATGDEKLIRAEGGEADGVADEVAPEAAGGGDDEGIVLARAHLFERQDGIRRDGAAIGGQGGGGDALVEDAIVEHEQEATIGGLGLESEEALGGVVGLHVTHVGRGDEAGVTVAVRLEADAAVEEDFEVRPNLEEGLRASVTDDGFDQDEHPGGYAGEAAHVGLARAPNNGADLGLPLVHEDNAARGYADEVDERVEILEQYGGEVAAMCAGVEGRRAMAAAKDESLFVEKAGAGVVAEVEGDGVESAGVVCPAEDVWGDGDVFAACVGRAAALCEPSRGSGPEHVALAVDHASDVGLQILVGADGDRPSEGLVSVRLDGHTVETVHMAPFRLSGGANQLTELPTLDGVGLRGVSLNDARTA